MGKIANFFIASETNNYRPPVLSAKAFLWYGLALLLLRVLLGVTVVSGSGVDSQTLMDLINEERQARNVNPLFIDQGLRVAAAEKSADMIERDYFAHVDPDGNYVWGRIVAAGYAPYKMLGENLAVNFATNEGMIAAWLQSPKHRDNLLNPEFVDQGLSAMYGDYQGKYTNLTTSLFGVLAPGFTREHDQVLAAEPVKKSETPPPPETKAAVTKNEPPKRFQPSPEQERQPAEVTPGVPAETTQVSGTNPLFGWPRLFFTLFGVLLLFILAIDSVIILKHETSVGRSHSSYHLSSFLLLVLISI